MSGPQSTRPDRVSVSLTRQFGEPHELREGMGFAGFVRVYLWSLNVVIFPHFTLNSEKGRKIILR